MRVRVRGIYSTALCYLLHDHGHELVDLTESQEKRFGASSSGSPELIINDTRDREGILLVGRSPCIDEVVELLRGISWQVVIKRFSGRAEGDDRAIAYFPVGAKIALDDLRSRVTYTLPMHHHLRAAGRFPSEFVTILEELVSEGRIEPHVVEERVRRVIEGMGPGYRSRVPIYHMKVNGRHITLGPATVYYEQGDVVLERWIKGFGTYDGLNVAKTPLDVAVSRLVRFGWTMETRYYGPDGRLKGTYVNVSTPINVYETRIWYIDLGIDVVRVEGSEPRVIDEEELRELVDQGCVSRRMYEEALMVVKRAVTG
ncbi:MAG: DUF402 domain-containing protein [Aigarchaeota archaeon]|nr:DUF402 domain-containing protein [Aigarchaeota archaeon]MDW8092350.1 DUF402 domain-containing protein [Nitrososphaerota archaeon]